MTQTTMTLGKEEVRNSNSDHPAAGDSVGGNEVEQAQGPKVQRPQSNTRPLKKALGKVNVSSPQEFSGGADNSNILTVYKNGMNQEATMRFNFTKDSKNARNWSAVLDSLSAAMSSKCGQDFRILKVFTVRGKRVLSAADLICCDEIVVCGTEPFQNIIYGSPVQDKPNSSNGKCTKLRRMECGPVESGTPVCSGRQDQSKNKQSVSKAAFSNIENSPMSDSMLRTITPRNVHSPKPRPVSSYHQGASARVGHIGDPGPAAGVVSTSRIPKFNSGRPSDGASDDYVNCVISSTKKNAKFRSPRTPKVILTPKDTSGHNTPRMDFIRPKLVSIICYGMKPRKSVRFLLNKRTARSYDQVLNDITAAIKPPWGAVHHVYDIYDGTKVSTLEDFFGADNYIFLVCANERINPDDFILDHDERKGVPQKKSEKDKTSTPTTAIPEAEQVESVESSQRNDILLSPCPSEILYKYEIGDKIGDGNFAMVKVCTDRQSRQRFALKIIDKSKYNEREKSLPDKEIAILATISHPNIVRFYEQFESSSEYFVVMELVEGGDLFDAISEVEKFQEKDTKSMIVDIASAVSYLHAHNIIHRDIKPENLLVYSQGDGQRHLKLGDFGLAEFVDGPMYTVCGTPTYVAPEMLRETGYGLEVDIWAFGVIVFILLCGYPPFASSSDDEEELFNVILSGELEFHPDHWDRISMDAKDIIIRMLERDADERLTAEEVLQHPWLATNPHDREERRKKMVQNDFRLNVFGQMGLAFSN